MSPSTPTRPHVSRGSALARLTLAAMLATALAACGTSSLPTAPGSGALRRLDQTSQPVPDPAHGDSTGAQTQGNYQNPPV